MKEICHTDIEFDSAGLDPLIEHIERYFQGNQLVPVSRAKNQLTGENLYFVFSNKLLDQMVKDSNTMNKSYESAVKYGFRGYSAGGQNGIFYQRKQDSELLSATDKLNRKHESEIRDFMQYSGDLADLRKIKIVTHNTKGQRIVGVYDENNAKAVFLDFANY